MLTDTSVICLCFWCHNIYCRHRLIYTNICRVLLEVMKKAIWILKSTEANLRDTLGVSDVSDIVDFSLITSSKKGKLVVLRFGFSFVKLR